MKASCAASSASISLRRSMKSITKTARSTGRINWWKSCFSPARIRAISSVGVNWAGASDLALLITCLRLSRLLGTLNLIYAMRGGPKKLQRRGSLPSSEGKVVEAVRDSGYSASCFRKEKTMPDESGFEAGGVTENASVELPGERE